MSTATTSQLLTQAKLLAEVARRVDRPLDALPPGDKASVALGLWHQAARCAVAAAMASAPADDGPLLRAAGSAELLDAIDAALKEPAAFVPDEQSSSAARAATLSGFTSRLIAELDAPGRATRRQRWQRVARYAVPGILPLLALLGVGIWVVRGPNLAETATMTLSSQYLACKQGECGTASFVTNDEYWPWVKYDFGKTRHLSSIVVENRSDCCWDRALPLLVEASDDNKKWRELVRTERPYLVFSHPLDAKARYVRLRLAGKNYLHLKSVTIR